MSVTRQRPRSFTVAITLLVSAGTSLTRLPASAQSAGTQPSALPVPDELRKLATSDVARRFLSAAERLPVEPPRQIFRDVPGNTWLSASRAANMPAAERTRLTPRTVDYYATFYGSPLAYVRAIDLVANQTAVFGTAAGDARRGPRVLDFGYGTVGHLRMLALMGCDVVGVDVDPKLTALYNDPRDQGTIRASAGIEGRITLVEGRWPSDDSARRAVGGGYDLIISKNTLKNGYLHPAQPVDKRMLVDLGVPEPAFLRALHAALAPRGCLMIYNICPALTPPGPSYKPWSDGKCPFTRAQWKDAGFEVIAIDTDDTHAVQALARALGWDKGEAAMDIQNDLVAHYTIVRRN